MKWRYELQFGSSTVPIRIFACKETISFIADSFSLLSLSITRWPISPAVIPASCLQHAVTALSSRPAGLPSRNPGPVFSRVLNSLPYPTQISYQGVHRRSSILFRYTSHHISFAIITSRRPNFA
ncbi:uncharacterized protein IAS62_001035 [Cryptococcus decagattii]|uniref:Uncharacterized protein n=1 Tax=Cryptococcus decagattii TaxID=1859122 RepID=A0ABZ2AMH6_9TREE